MGMNFTSNSINQIKKGTVLFTEGEQLSYLCLILKGSVSVQSKGAQIIIGTDNFIGANDAFHGKYLCSYVATEDTSVYAFPLSGIDSITTLFKSSPSYRGMLVHSFCNLVTSFFLLHDKLDKCAKISYRYLITHYDSCLDLDPHHFDINKHKKELKPPVSKTVNLEKKLSYFGECSKLPLDLQKQYFASSETMAFLVCEEISTLASTLIKECSSFANYIQKTYGLLISNDNSLLDYEISIAIHANFHDTLDPTFIGNIKSIKKVMDTLRCMYVDATGQELKDCTDKYNLALASLTKDLHLQKETALKKVSPKLSITDLNHSLEQILLFADATEDVAQSLKSNIDILVSETDRLSSSDTLRLAKREISKHFYDIYKSCLIKTFENDRYPYVIHLFLTFGFMDERLLTEEQLTFISTAEYEESSSPCQIYTMPQWLRAIYDGKKEPSKNDFDEDYEESLRSQRKNGYITEAEEKTLATDNLKKTFFEIDNLLTSCSKGVSGHISTFVPVLYTDSFIGDINRTFVTKEALNEVATQLLSIDYSAFYREEQYNNSSYKIDKEIILREVFPDIIIMPEYGINAYMWQEISGRRRNSPGRFLFPAFSDSDLTDLMIKMFARFRWELCRRIQGPAWNDIQVKSLTSEYSDYVQFYRKNRDLSEERAEKLKLQIQKAKKNTREVFVLDYDLWIKKESTGGLVLNKISREFLSTYCPFPKNLRGELANNITFKESMKRQQREYIKKIRELEAKFLKIEKNGYEVPIELQNTLRYYKEL